MGFLRSLFVWWNDATLGTQLATLLTGKPVGKDEFGNRYYESRKGRRWVIYAGTVEASRVPPEWHGWLHHTFKNPPTIEPPKVSAWEKDHLPNMTGTPDAYFPEGSLWAKGQRPHATGDYEPWRPD